MANHSADLHWCKAEEKDQILAGGPASMLDSKSVHQDKKVQMFASATVDSYNPQPPGFSIRREAFFLKKLVLKVGGHWRPMNPIKAVSSTTGKWFAEYSWETGSNNVTRQSRYFFRDKDRNSSGALTVTEVDFSTTRKGLKVNGKAVHKVPFVSEMGVDASAQSVTDIHRLGASRDPDVRVVLVHPGGEGEANLLNHVRDLLADTTESLPTEFSDGYLNDIADGYLARDTQWVPTFEDGSSVIFATVGPGKEPDIGVSLDDALTSPSPFRSAYAIRVVDVEDESNFVVSDIVEIEWTGELLQIRG